MRQRLRVTRDRFGGLAIAAVLLAAATSSRAAAEAPRKVEYNRDIRPILSDNCFYCHGPDAKHREGKFRLDTREGALSDRGGYAAIVPGNPDDSELVERISSDDPTLLMPPPKSNKKLTETQKDLLKRWIEQGAEYQPHWSYITPRRPPVPKLDDASLVRNPIDAFIQRPLADKGIKPAPEAGRRTLLRRLSLDLIGLPPTPGDVRAFLDDPSPNAYEAQVDRLLGSPHFGENMAQRWLDVARYADTVGYHGDQNQNAWAYRDYVIAAFNANKPFDQFTVEQLAGDLLPNPTTEQLVATCFNRLNMVTREGGAQPKEYLAKYTADRIRTVSMAWLGSTLNCTECHDHKFDPFTQKDFYSLGAFFADIKQWGVYSDYKYTPNPDLQGWTNDHPFPPEIVVPSPAQRRRIARLRGRIEETIAAAPPVPADLAAWTKEIRAFLADHPGGWETAEATVTADTSGDAKGRSRKTSPASDSDSPEAVATVESDGRIVFAKTSPAPVTIELRPAPGWLAAVRVELLPSPEYRGRIVRNGKETTVQPDFAWVGKKGESRPLAIRHAQADRYAPQYANGFETIGVQGGWKTDPEQADQPHTAVYFLDHPVRLAEGDRLRIRLPRNVLGCVRVSTTPLAPPDVQHPEFPSDLARSLDDGSSRRAAYLRGTAWNAAAFARVKALEAEVLECRDGKTPVMVTERSDKPLTIRVLARGNWMDETGAICRPATPHFLPQLPDAESRELTRLDLAKWLCAPENPLTARVIVNRFWKQFFGVGLAPQVDDLGAQGEPPSHPELLDWLAVEFRASGWDVKHAVKLIVMSHTYRQAAGPRPELRDLDPNNRWLAAQSPRRLEAENVRDNALAIAGLIDLEMGGPPSHPYQPADYYAGLQFPDRDYVADRDERQYRRGVYMHWQRTFLHPMLANFDAPSREDCIALRTATNSPQQALTLLNDPTFVEAARVWAGRLMAAPVGDDGQRLNLAFEQALARPIGAHERARLTAFLDRVRAEYRSHPEDAAKLARVGIAPAADLDPVELAAWTSACRVILNLHETITR